MVVRFGVYTRCLSGSLKVVGEWHIEQVGKSA